MAEKAQTSDDFNLAIEKFYNKDFASAAALFDAIFKRNPDDTVAARFKKTAAKYMYEGVPDSWTGAEKLDSK